MSTYSQNNVNYTLNAVTQTATVAASPAASGSISLPSTVTSAGVTYNVTSIAIMAFKNCSNLTSITISDSIIKIGHEAFRNCTKITSITIPSSVTSIGNAICKGCTTLTSITIPNNILNVGTDIIGLCPSNIVVNYNPTLVDLPLTGVTWYECFVKNSSNQIILDAYMAVIDSTNFTKLMYLKSDTTFSTNILSQYSNNDYGNDHIFLNGLISGAGIDIIDLPTFHGIYANAAKWQLYDGGISYQDATTEAWIDLAASTVSYTFTSIANPACFNEGTKILCLNKELEEQYVPVETLKVGDLVKTYKHGYRRIAVIGKKLLFNNPSVFSECMYRMEKTDSNGLLEDLVVTGWHSVLVDDLGTSKEENTARLGKEKMVDDKYMLLSSVSNDFKKVETNEPFTYYHFVLESDGDDTKQYGIYANNVLTETQCRKDFDQKDFTLV